MIMRDHRDIMNDIHDEASEKTLISQQDHKTNVKDAWNVLDGILMHLRKFFGGIEIDFSNKTTIEADLSVLKGEMDDYRSAM